MPATALQRLDSRSSLREQVTQAVQAALVAGEMRPGVVYSAPALAQRFGVSPTPVREALLDLAKEGLVEAVRNKGFRVTTLSEADLDEIYELRALLEVPTVRRLAGTLSADDEERLHAVAHEIEAAARTADLIAYLEADRRFHLALLELAGNRRLVAVVARLRAQARLFGLAPLAARGQLVASAEEHALILRRLADGDPDGAEDLVRRHLVHTRGIWAERPE